MLFVINGFYDNELLFGFTWLEVMDLALEEGDVSCSKKKTVTHREEFGCDQFS
jgi:hypothetical protein